MRILIVGAGVIGSVYGAKLLQSGHEIVMLARGERSSALRQYGLILEEAQHRRRIVLPVSVVDAVSAEDCYDLVLAPVRHDQLRALVPVVRKVSGDPNVLVFGNATGLCDELRAAFGERLLFGFPAAAGVRGGTTVRYVPIRQQKTMLGEPDGRATSRVRELRDVMGHAGFPATISSNPAGWLNAHTAFVVPIAYALYRLDTDAAKLASDSRAVRQMVRATREAFRALQEAGEAAIPTNLHGYTCVCPSRSRSATGVAYSPARGASCGSPRTVGRPLRRWTRSPPHCSPWSIAANSLPLTLMIC